jgi:hypothetical protein
MQPKLLIQRLSRINEFVQPFSCRDSHQAGDLSAVVGIYRRAAAGKEPYLFYLREGFCTSVSWDMDAQ